MQQVVYGSFGVQEELGGAVVALYTKSVANGWVELGVFDYFGDAETCARLLHIHTEVKGVY